VNHAMNWCTMPGKCTGTEGSYAGPALAMDIMKQFYDPALCKISIMVGL
jgi:hypothetical protein